MAKYNPATKLWEPEKKPGYDEKNGKMQPGDFHLVVNDESEKGKLFDHTGKFIKLFSMLAKGVNGRTTWKNGGDTPPGLWELGAYFPYREGLEDPGILQAYGRFCWDLIEHEGQETIRGRDGCCLHGKGDEPFQRLTPTLGCIRAHNQDLKTEILPRWGDWNEAKKKWVKKNNRFWVSCFQDYDR